MKIKITSEFTPNEYFPAIDKKVLFHRVEALLKCIITSSINTKCEVFWSDRMNEEIKKLFKKQYNCSKQVAEEIIKNLKVRIYKK